MCSLFKETAYWVSKLHWHFPLIFPNGNVSELHWNISELLWTPRGKPLEVSWVSGGKKTVRLRDSKEHRGKHRIRFLTLASMAQRHRKSGLRKMRRVNCEQKSMLQTLFQLTWRQEIAAGDFPEFWVIASDDPQISNLISGCFKRVMSHCWSNRNSLIYL